MKLNKEILKLLKLNEEINDIKYSERKLKKHIIQRKHDDVLPYFSELENILENPDYVGVNPNEKDISLECVKLFNDNVLVALKLNKNKNGFYVPTMYTINDYKLKRRILSGRLKKFDKIKKMY